MIVSFSRLKTKTVRLFPGYLREARQKHERTNALRKYPRDATAPESLSGYGGAFRESC
jgi:hypothetical protein